MAYTIDIYKNRSFSLSVTAKDCNDLPIELDSYDITGCIRNKYSDTGVLSNFSITEIPPSNSGIFFISLSAEETASLPVGQFLYAVDGSISGSVTNFLEGYANIYPNVASF